MRILGSLTVRLTATVVLLVAVAGLLVTVLTTTVMRDHLAGQLDQDVVAAQRRQVLELGGPQGPGPMSGIRDPRGQGVGTLTALISDEGSTGQIQADRGEGNEELSAAALDTLADLPADDHPRTTEVEGVGHYRLLVTDLGQVRLVSGVPTDRMDETVAELVGWGVGFTVLGVGVAGALAVVVVRRQLAPLRSVARTAHEVAGLPLSSGSVGVTARVPESLTDERTEVGQVGAALNTLLGHMESSLDARHRSEQQVRQFVADASHELRTPLATIQGYAELGLRSSTPAAELTTVLGKVQGESHRMSALVEDLLLLARLDAGRPLARDSVDVSRLVLEAVSDARVVAPGHHWRLDLPSESVTVAGDDQRLHQVLTNLLANARRHTPAGTTVTVTLRTEPPTAAPQGAEAAARRVVVAVHDDGPGIAPELQATVFERFTRGDASRTRDSGGAGLGLSLARAIAAAHGGTLSLVSEPGSTTFTLDLPA